MIASQQTITIPGNGTYLLTVNEAAKFLQVTFTGQTAGTITVRHRPLLPLPDGVTDLGALTGPQKTALLANEVEDSADNAINFATASPRKRTVAIPDRVLTAIVVVVAGTTGATQAFINQS